MTWSQFGPMRGWHINTVLPSDPREICREVVASADYWLAGGALRRYYSEELDYFLHDIDLFLKNGIVEKDFIETIKNAEILNEYSYGSYVKSGPFRFNIIPTKFSTVEELFYDFDLTISQFAWDPKTDKNYTGIYAEEDLETKSLRWVKIKSGPAGLKRLVKFLKEGYDLNADQQKIFLDTICDKLLSKSYDN
jgi:hypothetical protein